MKIKPVVALGFGAVLLGGSRAMLLTSSRAQGGPPLAAPAPIAASAATIAAPSLPAKGTLTEELAHEFLDFESARLALKACFDGSGESQLQDLLTALAGVPERDAPGPAPGLNIARSSGLKFRLGGCQIDLGAKSWWVGFRTTFTSDTFSGDFYKDENGKWVTSIRSKVHATVSPAR